MESTFSTRNIVRISKPFYQESSQRNFKKEPNPLLDNIRWPIRGFE